MGFSDEFGKILDSIIWTTDQVDLDVPILRIQGEFRNDNHYDSKAIDTALIYSAFEILLDAHDISGLPVPVDPFLNSEFPYSIEFSILFQSLEDLYDFTEHIFLDNIAEIDEEEYSEFASGKKHFEGRKQSKSSDSDDEDDEECDDGESDEDDDDSDSDDYDEDDIDPDDIPPEFFYPPGTKLGPDGYPVIEE